MICRYITYNKDKGEYIMEYLYGMKERGFSLGCQPKDGLLGLSDKSSDKYYDIIEYSRKLTEKEIKEYELDPIE